VPVRLFADPPIECPFCGDGDAVTREVHGRLVTYHISYGQALVQYTCGGALTLEATSTGWAAIEGECGASGKSLADLAGDHAERVTRAAIEYRRLARASRIGAVRRARMMRAAAKSSSVANAQPCGFARSGRSDTTESDGPRQPRLDAIVALKYGVPLRELRARVYGA
jgi:hypothetical protein